MARNVRARRFDVDVSTAEGCRAAMRHTGQQLRKLVEHYVSNENADFREQ